LRNKDARLEGPHQIWREEEEVIKEGCFRICYLRSPRHSLKHRLP